MGHNLIQVFPDGPPIPVFRRVEQIELEDFVLVGQGPVEGHHAETRQMLVFGEILLEGRQEFPGLDQGIVGAIGLQQPRAEMDVFQELLEQVAVPDGGGLFRYADRGMAVQFYFG